MFPKYVIAACVFWILIHGASINAASPGFLEGHLKIISSKAIELAGENRLYKPTAQNYADYPLIVLSQDGKKEIARLTPDENGSYRVALPPGGYILDVQGRATKQLRAKPRQFTVISNQTVSVDMEIDTDHRRRSSTRSFQPWLTKQSSCSYFTTG